MIIHEIESLISEVSEIGEKIRAGLEGNTEEQTKFAKDLQNALDSKGIGEKFDTLVADAKKTIDELGADLVSFFGKAKSGIATVIDNIKAEADRTPGNIKQIGQNIKDEFNRTPDNIKNMYDDAANYAQKTLTKLQQTPDDISSVVSGYFEAHASNPAMRTLSNLSIENPATFNALVVAVPLVLVGALSAGSYAIIKKIKNSKDAQVELAKATAELENAKNDSAKAAASKKVALIGAKAIVLAKVSK